MSIERYEVIASYPQTGSDTIWSLASLEEAISWAKDWFMAQPANVRDELRGLWIEDSVTGKTVKEF